MVSIKMRKKVNEKTLSLTQKRESTKLDIKNENLDLYETYCDDKEHEGEYLLQGLMNHNDIYEYIKDLREKKSDGWREEIAGFLGMADIIKEKLKDEFDSYLIDSREIWHYISGNLENIASPVRSKIMYTIDHNYRLQETELKLEAINDFIHFAEYACNYHDYYKMPANYPKRVFRF